MIQGAGSCVTPPLLSDEPIGEQHGDEQAAVGGVGVSLTFPGVGPTVRGAGLCVTPPPFVR